MTCMIRDCRSPMESGWLFCTAHVDQFHLREYTAPEQRRPTATAPCDHRGELRDLKYIAGLARVERVVWCPECGAFAIQPYGQSIAWELPRSGAGRESARPDARLRTAVEAIIDLWNEGHLIPIQGSWKVTGDAMRELEDARTGHCASEAPADSDPPPIDAARDALSLLYLSAKGDEDQLRAARFTLDAALDELEARHSCATCGCNVFTSNEEPNGTPYWTCRNCGTRKKENEPCESSSTPTPATPPSPDASSPRTEAGSSSVRHDGGHVYFGQRDTSTGACA